MPVALGSGSGGYYTRSISRRGRGGPQPREMLKWAVTAPLGINSKCTKSSDAEYEKAHSRAWAGLVTWAHLRFRHAGGRARAARAETTP